MNAQGGVTVAGKKYKIKLVARTTRTNAAKTVTNGNSLINDTRCSGSSTSSARRTTSAIRDLVNTQCVPNL